jgi:RNA polymerase sigma-70 factor (ECF subfamily)
MSGGLSAIFRNAIPSVWASMDTATGGVVGLALDIKIGDAERLKTDSPEQRIIHLYDSLRPSLYRYLINIGVSPQDVEEVVQESFLRLFRHLRSGGNEDNLRGWIFKVAHNLSINVFQGKRHQIEVSPELWQQLSLSVPDRTPSPEGQLLQQERIHRIKNGLADLTQLQRNCLNLRVAGFRYREIGEILNIGTSTVASSLRNAIARIMKRRA